MALKIDVDDFEDLILNGEFSNRIEACRWAQRQAGWTGKSRWSSSRSWADIKDALMPDAYEAYCALPLGSEVHSYDEPVPTWRAAEALRDGVCWRGHAVRGLEDLAPDGKGKLTCRACRMARSRNGHEGSPRSRWTAEEDEMVLNYTPIPGRSRTAMNQRRARLQRGREPKRANPYTRTDIGNPWQDWEDTLVLDYKPVPGRSPDAVRCRRYKLRKKSNG